MNKKELDLDRMVDEVIRVLYPTYEQAILGMKNAIIQKKQRIRQILEYHIKSACEFYLRYKDKPALFSDEQFTIDWKYDRLTGTYIVELGNRYTEYNYWLFKLAFKSVLDEELKVFNE